MAKPLNYSTRIDSARTVQECQAILVGHGVQAVQVTYAGSGPPTGLAFVYNDQRYDLPVNVDRMAAILAAARRSGAVTPGSAKIKAADFAGPDHAARVAWRVVKDWLEAQMALVAAQQVDLPDVMLPYLTLADGRSLREHARENLPALTSRST